MRFHPSNARPGRFRGGGPSVVVRKILLAAMALALLGTMAAPALASTVRGGAQDATPLIAQRISAAVDDGEGAVVDETQKVTVPKVTGKTLSEATNSCNAVGLHVEVAPGGSQLDTAPVISQDPVARKKVAFGSTITLTTEPDEHVITDIYVGYQDPTTEEYIRYPDPSLGQVPLITTKGGSIDLIASVLWKGGSLNGTAQDATELDVGTIEWISLTPDIAEVEPWTGKVTALADGEAIIRCELKDKYKDPTKPDGVFATIAVRIIGQTGPYVADVSVIDEFGRVYGADPVPIYSFDGTTFMQFFVRAIYTDGVNVEERTTVPRPADESQVIEGFPYADPENPIDVTWSVSSAEIGFVNEDTGNFRPLRDGTVQVIASIAGGISGPVTDYATVSINTGTYENGAPPSETLTVHVEYSNGYLGEIASKTYSQADVLALAASTDGGVLRSAYTMLNKQGSYMTLVAEGIKLRTLLADIGVAISDVEKLSFSATDGVNNAEVGISRLFTASGNAKGYYFPYCGTSGLEYGRQLVEPMLAINSYSYIINSNEDENLDDLYALMDGQNAFRFCFGVTSRDDFNADRNIYKITDLRVLLTPPAIDPDEEDQEGTEQPPDDEQVDEGTEDGDEGPGDGDGEGGDEGPGGEDEGAGGDEPGDGMPGEEGPGDASQPGDETPGDGQQPEQPGDQVPDGSDADDQQTPGQTPQQPQQPDQPNQPNQPDQPNQPNQPSSEQDPSPQPPVVMSTVNPQPPADPTDAPPDADPIEQPDPAQTPTPLSTTSPEQSSDSDEASEDAASGEPSSESGEEPPPEEEPVEEPEQLPEEKNRWQLYEMMAKTDSELDVDYSNPLEPFFLPGAFGVMAVGGIVANQRFRKELRPLP